MKRVLHVSGPSRGEAGFTLVELLVALTLLGLLSVMIFGGLRFGTQSWNAVIATSADRDRIAQVQSFLRARLHSASDAGRARARRDPGDVRVFGDAQALTFIGPWLGAVGAGGLYQFALERSPHIDDELLLRWRPATPVQGSLSDETDRSGHRVLLTGLEELSISYFGSVDDRAPMEWHDAWLEEDIKPTLVRIDLTLGDRRAVWPPLVIQIPE